MLSGNRLTTILALCFVLLAALNGPVMAQENPDDGAKALFEQYATMEQAHDPARFAMYADDAKITIFRAYKNGQRLREKITLDDYKNLLQEPATTPRVFSNTVYSQVENIVRVRTQQQRTAEKKKAAPSYYVHQFVLGKDPAGGWRILEETTTLDAEQ